MKTSSCISAIPRVRVLLLGATLAAAGMLLTACGPTSSTTPDTSQEQPQAPSGAPAEEKPTETEETSLQQIDGRAVSATDIELVLRTADGERTFQIAEEDVQAIDPSHFSSHANVADLGFRVFYRTEGTLEYAISVEEIPGSSLGFD